MSKFRNFVKCPVGGNEFEPDDNRKPLAEVLRTVAREFKVSAHTKRLELMDLLAAKECIDARFLASAYGYRNGREKDFQSFIALLTSI